MTHQELLNAWLNARIGLIWERSTQIRTDVLEACAKAEAYAIEHGLEVPPQVVEERRYQAELED